MCAAVPAQAQVTVNLQALEPLATKHTVKKPPPAHAARPSHRQIARKREKPQEQPTVERPAQPPATVATAPPAPNETQSAAPANVATALPAPAPPPATLPTAPPAAVALAPVPPPPAAPEPAPPPPPPPISDTAASAATKTGAGLRVTFGSEQADLSPASAAAIKSVVQAAPTGDSTTFNVVAYAAGTPEDPSTARRLSLARALAVRSALIEDGISSSRIYVRALGATGGDETPDRVDVAVMGGNAPLASPASAPAPDNSPKSQSQ